MNKSEIELGTIVQAVIKELNVAKANEVKPIRDINCVDYEDYLSVKVIAYTKPSADFDGDDMHDIIAYCAKVSNKKNQSDLSKSEKLIDYLFKNSHYSPFEMANIVIEINTTRDIARQLLRHRSMGFQEFSQRYEEVDNTFIISEARMQDKKNRQNSIELDDASELQMWWTSQQIVSCRNAYDKYMDALEKGIAKEVARKILPEGNTPSKLYVNGNLRSWLHYLQLRSGNGTQKEHMMIAEKVIEAIDKIFNISKFLNKEVSATGDNRPESCRNRLKAEGKPYPRSGCYVTGCNSLFGVQICTGVDRTPSAARSGDVNTGQAFRAAFFDKQ